MQFLLQARAALWIAVVTSCGHGMASVGGTAKTLLDTDTTVQALEWHRSQPKGVVLRRVSAS